MPFPRKHSIGMNFSVFDTHRKRSYFSKNFHQDAEPFNYYSHRNYGVFHTNSKSFALSETQDDQVLEETIM